MEASEASNVNLLVLGVAHRGMAIPLLWRFLTKDVSDEVTGEITAIGKRGNSDYQERQALIEDFIRIFGKERIGALTADREFIGKEWFSWLTCENIPFVIRIRNNILIDDKEFDAKSVGELFTHLPKDTITTYQKRWEIETMFGALKSKGFNFEESKISEQKVEKLMAFLSISFLWTMLAGKYRAKEEPIALKKVHTAIYPIKSIFKHGLEWLKNVLVNITIKKKEFSLLLDLLRESFRKIYGYGVVEGNQRLQLFVFLRDHTEHFCFLNGQQIFVCYNQLNNFRRSKGENYL